MPKSLSMNAVQCLLIGESVLPGRWRAQRHSHQDCNELIAITRGKVGVWVNGQEYHGVPGTVFAYPRGLEHVEWTLGEEVLRFHAALWNWVDSTVCLPFMSYDTRGRIRTVLAWANEYSQDTSSPDATMLDSLLYAAIKEILRNKVHQSGSEHLSRAKEFMDNNFATPMSISDLAREACMSTSNFIRCFSREVGCPPMSYLRQLRTNSAIWLLHSTKLSHAEIAALSGFADEQQLYRAVVKSTGRSPSQLRKPHGQDV